MDNEGMKWYAQSCTDQPGWPKAGEAYHHYKGGIYDVIAMAVHESELIHLVIYRSREKGYVWARPVANWLEMVNGVPRFVKLEEGHAHP